MNRTERKDHLRRRANAPDRTLVVDFYPGYPLAIERQSGNQCARQHRQIRLVHDREDIGAEDGLSFALANPQVDNRGATGALHQSSVLVLIGWDANTPCSLEHSKSLRTGYPIDVRW